MKETVRKVLDKSRQTYKSLPDKKQHVEFFTALLSVPVLLTVILLNVNNLRSGAKTQASASAPTPTPVKEIVYINSGKSETVRYISSEHKETVTPTATPISTITAAPLSCDRSIGPVVIKTPEEGSVISDNPVSVLIDYDQDNHCAVVWAYRTNGGSWSEYDDKSIALYDMPNGQVVFELRVKSIVTGEEQRLQRTFSYSGNDNTIKTASSSAN